MKPVHFSICALVLCASCSSLSSLVRECDKPDVGTSEAAQLSWSKAGRIQVHEIDYSTLGYASRATEVSDPVVKPVDNSTASNSKTLEGVSEENLEEVIENERSPINGPKPVPPADSDPQLRASPLLLQENLPAENGDFSEWNTLCILAFVFCMIGFTALFATTIDILGWLIVAGIVLGIIGLVQASIRDQRGKGFAITAIALPVVLFVLLLIWLTSHGGWGN